MEFLTIDPEACERAAKAIAEIGALCHQQATVESYVIYERLAPLLEGHEILTKVGETLTRSPTLAVTRAGGE
jgi:hypothetical protein